MAGTSEHLELWRQERERWKGGPGAQAGELPSSKFIHDTYLVGPVLALIWAAYGKSHGAQEARDALCSQQWQAGMAGLHVAAVVGRSEVEKDVTKQGGRFRGKHVATTGWPLQPLSSLTQQQQEQVAWNLWLLDSGGPLEHMAPEFSLNRALQQEANCTAAASISSPREGRAKSRKSAEVRT